MDHWDRLWKREHNDGLLSMLSGILPAGQSDYYWRWKRYEIFLDRMRVNGPRIIELGCGSGIMTFRMLERFGGEAVLIDKSKYALEAARKYSRRFDIDQGNVEYVSCDIFSFEDPEGFDIVHSQGLIEHFPDQSAIIGEHFRFAKKGGYVLILAPRPSVFYRSARRFIEYCRGEWPFGYENPLETGEVLELVKKNGGKIIKKRNFMFSMGYLSQKV